MNSNNIITVERLADFYAKLQELVLPSYLTKQSAADTYAEKEGTYGDFAISNLQFKLADSENWVGITSADPGTNGLMIYASEGGAMTLNFVDGCTVALNRGSYCLTSHPTAYFSHTGTDYAGANSSYSSDSRTIITENAGSMSAGSIVYFPGNTVGSNPQGFYKVDSARTSYSFVCAPIKDVMYCRIPVPGTDNDPVFEYWGGTSFVEVSTGSGSVIEIEGNQYGIATDEDIDYIFNPTNE